MEVTAIAVETGVQVILDLEENETVGRLRQRCAEEVFEGHVDPDRVSLTIDGELVGIDDEEQELRDMGLSRDSVVEARVVIGVKAPANYLGNQLKWMCDVCISPDGRAAYCASHTEILGYDTEAGDSNGTIGSHDKEVVALAISPDGDTLYSASCDATIRVWNIATQSLEVILRGHGGRVYGLAVSPCGRRLYSCSRDQSVCIWSLETNRSEKVLNGHTGYVLCIALSKGGNHLYSGGEDGTVRVWHTTSYEEAVISVGGRVMALAVFPRSHEIDSVYCASHTGVITCYDSESRAKVTEFRGHSGWVGGIAITADGSYLLSCGKDCTLRAWNTSGTALGGKTYRKWMKAVTISSCGRYVYVCGQNDVVYVEKVSEIISTPLIPTEPSDKGVKRLFRILRSKFKTSEG